MSPQRRAPRYYDAIEAPVFEGGMASTSAKGLLQAGLARQAEGRFAEAVQLLRQAVGAAPEDAAGWAALAGALSADRRPEAALSVCEAGLKRLPGAAALLCAKATVLQGLSRVAEAADAWRAALAADPACFEARMGLALQAVEVGDWDAAEALAAPVSGSEAPPVIWLAARIAQGRGDFAKAEIEARRALAGPGLAADQAAETSLLLGDALDGLGRHAEAFSAYRAGKAALRSLYAERAKGRESELDRLTRLARWFETADPAQWGSAAGNGGLGPAKGHAFLVGFPRSGTTLLEQALAGHSQLVALEEAPTLAEPYAALMANTAGLERLAGLTEAEAEGWRAAYWRSVAEHGAEATGKVFLDKAPAGTLYLPLIARLFPDARILFAIRDPRDVVLSCFRSSFAMNALTYAFTDLAEAVRCHAATMTLADVYRRVLPTQLVEVRYEALVDDFEGELGRICGALGLDLQPGMLDVAATASGRSVRTPSAPQVRAGLNRQGLGRWRAYAAELAPVLPILRPWIERFGYLPD